MAKNSRAITVAAGIGMAAISTEHFFSAGLSSPITTRKFLAEGAQDRAEVERAVGLAVLLSLAAGAVLSHALKQPWPLMTTFGVALFYGHEYDRALSEVQV